MKIEKLSPGKLFWQIITAEKQEVRSIYIFAIFQGLVSLSLPLGIQSIINFIQAGSLSTSWYVLIIFVLAGIFLAGLLQLKQLQVIETIEQRLFVNVSFNFAHSVPRILIPGLHGKYIPEVLNRFFEVTTVQKGMAKILLDFSSAFIQIIFGVLLLSLYNPMFALLGAALVIILLVILKITGPIGLRTSIEESKYKFQVAHWLQEVGRTLSTFKLAGNTPLPTERADKLTGKYLDARNKHFKVLLNQYRALVGFKVLVAAGLVILGSILVVNREINIGQFVAAEIVVLMLIASIEKIILNMSVVYDVLTALDKLEDVAVIETERTDGVDVPADEKNEGLAVSIKNLSFSFENDQTPIIKNVSLEIARGEIVCVKGSNGSGKTTLLKLMSGFYENYGGTIAYNDMPLGSIKLDSLRNIIGENFSEQEIFRGTVYENISCGRIDVDTNAIMNAVSSVGLTEFIKSISKGLNSDLEPEGQGLPGGVKRRLILARCFACNPRLLLIEDTLIGQSKEERELFFEVLFKQCRNITTLIVTNDDEVAKRCNRVLILDDGVLINSN